MYIAKIWPEAYIGSTVKSVKFQLSLPYQISDISKTVDRCDKLLERKKKTFTSF